MIASIDVAAKKQQQRWTGEQTISATGFAGFAPGDQGLSLSRDGRLAATIRQSIVTPPEIALGPIGAMHAVTSANAHATHLTGPVRSLTWTSDGTPVQGWLIFPPHAEPGARYPIVTIVHGGPAYAHDAFFPSGPERSKRCSPRAATSSSNRTRAAATVRAKRSRARTSRTSATATCATSSPDWTRSARRSRSIRSAWIFGWSYGGYMTMWAVTQTNRFKAAVSGAGLSDWLSYYGTNDIDTWMIPYFGASVYDDPQVYAKSSPIDFIKQVHTPTLMVAGDRDAEVPVTQSYEYWHALRDLHVPAELVISPGEGHELAKPADQRDVARRVVGWFDRWLK